MTVAAASPSPLATFRIIASDIKLAHSVFALPFAILAAVMAAPWMTPGGGKYLSLMAPGWTPPTSLERLLDHGLVGKLGLIVIAMVFARTVAMLANRLLDARIDKDNPRTASRAIPSGRLASRTALLVLVWCAIAFCGVCSGFGWFYGNWWPLWLSVPVLAWISAYGWFKRFTSLCHIYLGSSLAMSPIAAAIAIDPESIVPGGWHFSISVWLLAAMVLCWVAGFDIIYALQDVDADRAQDLHSMPSRLGVKKAMLVSRVLHGGALACLIACWWFDPRLGLLFGIGVGIVGALLTYEHLTVARWGTTRLSLAFFTLNGVISGVLGTLGVIDILFV